MYIFILLCSLVVKVGCPTPPESVTCQASATAFGQPANVTCAFHTNLERLKTEIMVVHHRFDADNDDLGTDVLVCFQSENSDKPNCIAREGYTFIGTISDRLTLEIPEATPERTGKYACHIVPPDGFVVHSCNLSVSDNANIPPDASFNGPSNATCSQTDGCQAKITGLTIALVCETVMLLFAVSGVFLLCCIIRRRNIKPEDEEIDPDSTEPLLPPMSLLRQSTLLQTIWSRLAKLLRIHRTVHKPKDTDTTVSRSVIELTEPDTTKKRYSISGNFLEQISEVVTIETKQPDNKKGN